MKKKLSEMSLEELWELFPVILKDYNSHYPEWYEEEKINLLRITEKEYIKRINHIGSTAVKGLISKPTVDILLELDKNTDVHSFITPVIKNGWTVMSDNNSNDFRISLNKGYTPEGFAEKVFHLHIRPYGDWNELYFRDYLNGHKETAEEYAELKKSLLKDFRNNRDGYTEAKTSFVLKYSETAKKIYKNRYI